MANFKPKGVEYMRSMAPRGGMASGETRHRKKVEKMLGLDPVPAELLKRPNHAGGSHQND